jgi:hypothetical protein
MFSRGDIPCGHQVPSYMIPHVLGWSLIKLKAGSLAEGKPVFWICLRIFNGWSEGNKYSYWWGKTFSNCLGSLLYWKKEFWSLVLKCNPNIFQVLSLGKLYILLRDPDTNCSVVRLLGEFHKLWDNQTVYLVPILSRLHFNLAPLIYHETPLHIYQRHVYGSLQSFPFMCKPFSLVLFSNVWWHWT